MFGRWKDTALRLRREAVEEARRANTLREQKLDEREHKLERLQNDLPGLLAEERARSGPPDIQLDTVFNACEPPFLCSVLVGAANGDWDLLESIDGPCVPHINYSVDQTPVHGSLNDLWARVY